jgi:hypothetical protein
MFDIAKTSENGRKRGGGQVFVDPRHMSSTCVRLSSTSNSEEEEEITTRSTRRSAEFRSKTACVRSRSPTKSTADGAKASVMRNAADPGQAKDDDLQRMFADDCAPQQVSSDPEVSIMKFADNIVP